MTSNNIPTPRLVSQQITREDLESMEEGERCNAGLMCIGLRLGNYPAYVGWHLDIDHNGNDVSREDYAWRFQGDPLGGLYCEDCTLAIEEAERKYYSAMKEIQRKP